MTNQRLGRHLSPLALPERPISRTLRITAISFSLPCSQKHRDRDSPSTVARALQVSCVPPRTLIADRMPRAFAADQAVDKYFARGASVVATCAARSIPIAAGCHVGSRWGGTLGGFQFVSATISKDRRTRLTNARDYSTV